MDYYKNVLHVNWQNYNVYGTLSPALFLVRVAKRSYTIPVLSALQWLLVKYRVQFKRLTLIHNAIHDERPCYIKDTLV